VRIHGGVRRLPVPRARDQAIRLVLAELGTDLPAAGPIFDFFPNSSSRKYSTPIFVVVSIFPAALLSRNSARGRWVRPALRKLLVVLGLTQSGATCAESGLRASVY
jgi:hypothetical protein